MSLHRPRLLACFLTPQCGEQRLAVWSGQADWGELIAVQRPLAHGHATVPSNCAARRLRRRNFSRKQTSKPPQPPGRERWRARTLW